MKRMLIGCMLLATTLNAWSEETIDQCFLDAGKRYNVEPNLLKAIAYVESSLDPGAKNTVGDVGLMQINPFWFSLLAEYGIKPANLEQPCVNANIGAWILAQNFVNYGRGWEAVGRYHAGTSSDTTTKQRAENYAQKVKSIYLAMR